LYRMLYLHRFRLKTPYPSVVSWVSNFLYLTFSQNEYILLVDYTGVGKPVVDLLRENDLPLVAINISGGIAARWHGMTEASVPKTELITAMSIVMQEYRIKIPNDIDLADQIKKEFINFKLRINKNANTTFSAAHGYHDDIVLSMSLAIWYGEYMSKKGKKRRIITGN